MDVETFEESETDVSPHSENHMQLINDHISIATNVECPFSVESSEERGHVGDRNPTRDDQSMC
ncbi:hypothetical protein Csa_015111 [Cucumis sativus]|uniref:Uncharacterized protein n=1 Tax=Cucumis sativus TaxID=3659 RepID=A0A0A0KV41_CUCSA|nr:hypothetical protein Csa_015111 [Cucumis sativus]